MTKPANKNFMYILRNLICLFLVIIHFNCKRAEYSYAVSLYENNQSALADLVEQVVIKKNITSIRIRKKAFYEKLFTLNFRDKSFVDIDKTEKNYKFIKIESYIDSNNFNGIAEEYFKKIDYKFTDKDIIELNSILNFMYSNNVDIIQMKIPEFFYLTLMIGFETGIEYRFTGALDFSAVNSIQIKDDWYFVEY
jgi:hypothetical protein